MCSLLVYLSTRQLLVHIAIPFWQLLEYGRVALLLTFTHVTHLDSPAAFDLYRSHFHFVFRAEHDSFYTRSNTRSQSQIRASIDLTKSILALIKPVPSRLRNFSRCRAEKCFLRLPNLFAHRMKSLYSRVRRRPGSFRYRPM